MNESDNNKSGGFLGKINIFRLCHGYHVPLRQCPHFLFPVMGLVTIGAMLATYYVAVSRRVEQPEIIALLVIGVAAVTFTIGHFIVAGFSQMAEANRLKSEFVSVVSHQLRTPLTGLRWSIESILSGRFGELSDRQKEFFDIIKESNDRMIKLVNNLLDVSRVEGGRVLLDIGPVSLVRITEEVLEDVMPLARAGNVDVQLTVDDAVPLVLADPVKIRIIVQNLVDNAIKYIKGSGKVSIEIKKRRGFLEFSVQDTGVGIVQEDQKQIFGKFFRSRNILKHKTEGTGLGLFISKSYVELMGGAMNFASRAGEGTTFRFTVPVVPPEAIPSSAAQK